MVASKVFSPCKTILKVYHKVTNIAWTDITFVSLLQYLDKFLSTFCAWRVISSQPEEFFKKNVPQNFIKFTGKHLHLVEVLYFRTSILQMSARACRSLQEFFFRKILGFYYKRNRQLFYYEDTSPYITLNILERINRVIFRNSSELLLLNISQQSKTCSKMTAKECFKNVIWVSL